MFIAEIYNTGAVRNIATVELSGRLGGTVVRRSIFCLFGQILYGQLGFAHHQRASRRQSQNGRSAR